MKDVTISNRRDGEITGTDYSEVKVHVSKKSRLMRERDILKLFIFLYFGLLPVLASGWGRP